MFPEVDACILNRTGGSISTVIGCSNHILLFNIRRGICGNVERIHKSNQIKVLFHSPSSSYVQVIYLQNSVCHQCMFRWCNLFVH